MYKHKRNSSAGGGSLKDEAAAPGFPLPKVRNKHSEGDILDMVSSSQESQQWATIQDETDSLPPTLRFNYFDICCIIFSIVTYVMDLGMDCYVAYVYYKGEWIGYFVLTLVFVIVPAGTMTAFSLRWYVQDLDNQSIFKVSCWRWVIRTIFLLLQLAPVLRYADSLIYGLKSRKAAKVNDKYGQIKYYTLMVNEDADSTLLRLFEAFMESAPQVTLQLYVFIYHLNDAKGPFATLSSNVQALTIFTSLVSLAWALTSYHRSLRYAQPDKANISYKGTVLQFVWHFCTISARIFALSVFAACYPIFVLPVCVAHWVAMLTWLLVQGKRTCPTQCEETLFVLVVAFIYIFTFFNILEEPTRYKYLTFYIISFLENSILLATWFLSADLSAPLEVYWFRIAGIVGDYLMFFIGLICMILYYLYFHPTMSRRDSWKSTDLEKESGIFPPQIPATEHPRTRTEFLTRRASLDQNIVLLTTASNPSSRRNVTFAMDKLSLDKSGRSNSCGDTLDSAPPAQSFDKSKILLQAKTRGESTANSPTIAEKSPRLTEPAKKSLRDKSPFF